nr:PREDICTED: telomere repeats-binding bouquet formation protein 2 [Anolis carolinensis]|eukprot:XP_008118927.1 PREDICTED: telomere repeats-binding bouquet formation protein 2 [Anolis carolinensis]
MFNGGRAWFSQSVGKELCRLWVAEGGVITNQDAADYLFSSDASHPDTKRIHQSLDYLEDRITVFHSCYLATCANSDTKDTVPLGHFVLPPACLHQGMCVCLRSFYQFPYNFIGYASAKEMKKFRGEMCDFIPGSSGYLAYWIPNETNDLSVAKTKVKRK